MGLDGQDPKLTDRFIAEGKLPNFAKLAAMGSYHRLRTTFPSVSPVAWSTFSTGVSPAKHNIFDFLDRDLRTYLPVLSSTHIGRPARVLKLGRYRIPLSRPELRLLRKSKPFWCILGDHHIWSTVLRVPITFPPDKFYGAELSAMCVPDLLGTQGTFTLFTTRAGRAAASKRAARVCSCGRTAAASKRDLEGPPNSLVAGEPTLTIPLAIRADENRARIDLRMALNTRWKSGKLSDWITLTFPAAPLIKVSGICRMLVTEMGEHVSLYVTPINIDPEKPAMPISHPPYYATYLAKKIGQYSTLGLAEDTWALNEGVIDDGTFLQQTYDIDGERERMFFAGLDKLRQGSLVCVFDATDRIQHMFWRYIDPAASCRPRARDGRSIATPSSSSTSHNDALVGRVHGAADRRRRPDGAVRSRVQLVPPRRQSQQLAARQRLSHAQARRGWRRGVAARRRLVADARVCPGPHRPVSQHPRTRSAGDCRAGRGRGAAAEGARRQAVRPARRRSPERSASPKRSRPRAVLRSVSGERAGPADRLQRRLSDVVGLCHGRRLGAGVRGQPQGLERRPLHRPASGAWRALLQSAHRLGRSGADRHRADGAAPVRRSSLRPIWKARSC